jgi:hypothetical protein
MSVPEIRHVQAGRVNAMRSNASYLVKGVVHSCRRYDISLFACGWLVDSLADLPA